MKIEDSLQQIGIPKRFRKAKMEDFPEFIQEQASALFGGSSYVYGPTGVGKSHFAAALVRYGIETKRIVTAYRPEKAVSIPSARFENVPNLLFELRQAIGSNHSTGASIIKNCSQTDFLVLDDLGAEKATEWALESLYLIINRRYEACLPSVFTGNLPIKGLSKRLGQRITRRMAGMCKEISLKDNKQ